MLNEKKPFNYNTLEPKILKANNLERINDILKKNLKTADEMHIHMRANKTEVALEIFSSKTAIDYPEFIKSAIAI